MHGGAPVVARAVRRAEQVHAGQRRQARLGDVGAGIQHAFHVEHRALAGAYGEAVGAGGACGVQQGMNDHGPSAGAGTFQPERAEARELLAARVAGADGEAAGRDAIHLVLGDGAEVAGAQEHHGLGEHVRPVQPGMEAEAGEAQVRQAHRRVGPIEQVGRVGDAGGLPGLHLEHLDRRAIQEAAREELHLERPAVPPQRTVGLVGDGAILLIGQLVHRPGQAGVGCGIGLLAERLRQAADGGAVKRRRPRRIACGAEQGARGQGGAGLKEVASVQRRYPGLCCSRS